jgi:hypothetical protein
VLILAGARHWDGLVPRQVPAELPAVPLLLVAAIGLGAAAAVFAPVPPLLARSRTRPSAPAETPGELVPR